MLRRIEDEDPGESLHCLLEVEPLPECPGCDGGMTAGGTCWTAQIEDEDQVESPHRLLEAACPGCDG